jgi:hypothetical protein
VPPAPVLIGPESVIRPLSRSRTLGCIPRRTQEIIALIAVASNVLTVAMSRALQFKYGSNVCMQFGWLEGLACNSGNPRSR